MDEKKVAHAKENLYLMADFFSLFGDSSRISIISLLFDREYCVGDIAAELDMSQSAVSHQLKTLKNGNIVKTRREGKQIYYSLDDKHVEDIFAIAYRHIAHMGGKE